MKFTQATLSQVKVEGTSTSKVTRCLPLSLTWVWDGCNYIPLTHSDKKQHQTLLYVHRSCKMELELITSSVGFCPILKIPVEELFFQSNKCWVYHMKINSFSLSQSQRKARGRGQYTVYLFFLSVFFKCPLSVPFIPVSLAFSFLIIFAHCFSSIFHILNFCVEPKSWVSTNLNRNPFRPIISWL